MTKVYVGNLPLDVKERELEDLFYKVRRAPAPALALVGGRAGAMMGRWALAWQQPGMQWEGRRRTQGHAHGVA